MSWAMQQLRLRLRPILRLLSAASARRAAENERLARAQPRYVLPAHASSWLSGLDGELASGRLPGERAALTTDEEADEERLRAAARADGTTLPLDEIVAAAELDAFEVEALLLCAAVELDPRWAGVIGFVSDEADRRHPTVALLAALSATLQAELPERRRALGRLGRLRRTGLLQALPSPDEELALGPRVLAALLGNEKTRFADPLQLDQRPAQLPDEVDGGRLQRLGHALRHREVEVVGLWGGRMARNESVRALGAALGRPVRVLPALDSRLAAADWTRLLTDATADAAALGSLLWIDIDALLAAGGETAALAAGDALERSATLACLTAGEPYRPAALMAARPWAELTLPAPTYLHRRALWSRALPELSEAQVADLAARFRFDAGELAAAARTARTAAVLARNGHTPPVSEHIELACAQLVRKRTHSFARVMTARRSEADLVLPPGLHAQVAEIAHTFRRWPRVCADLGLDRLGSGGLKVLFTGEPGTGKTLSAEVIATQLGLPLVKIDLAQLVSKWVGETEKNLESVFREAEDGNTVLFFDEAESLFGKRGNVRHGTDRYANLEVSFLLQRLETYEGLVILASNLRDEIDDAFTRRFQAVLHFPRPGERERRRLWEMALPTAVPRGEVDLAVLAKIDLTGAAIFSAARSAVLRMVERTPSRLEPLDLIHGVAQQLQREARLLTASDLGPYAPLWRQEPAPRS